MIHGHYGIGHLQVFGGKHSIRWQGSDEAQALAAQTVKRRFDDLQLLTTQVAALAGMGIQATDQNSRFLNGKACL
jgi:hypothetical protein